MRKNNKKKRGGYKKIQKIRKSRNPEIQKFGNLGIRNTVIQEFGNLRIRNTGNQESGFPGIQGIRKSGNPGNPQTSMTPS